MRELNPCMGFRLLIHKVSRHKSSTPFIGWRQKIHNGHWKKNTGGVNLPKYFIHSSARKDKALNINAITLESF